MVRLRLQGVTRHFGEVKAVHDVSLEIEKGELFFLLGPSGCGKTTLLRLIAGFYSPSVGKILFDDHDVSNTPPHRRNTGMVFQNYALWPHMSVRENVAYGLGLRKVPQNEQKRRVSEALNMVRMEDYGARSPNQLSGGQQQRVALARALVIQPDVVLLDEPLSNLDARLRLEMRDEIRRIHAETGTTMVYVTHDQQEALSMADRLSVMNLGSVIQTDDPQTIYTRPTSAFVADFIGETNLIMGKLKSAKATAADTLDPVDSTVVADARDTANSSLVIETAVGQLHSIVYPVTDLFPGDEVVCSIRPESLQILHTGETKAEGQNLLHATVCQAMYLGSHEQYLVKLVDDTQIKLVDYHPERHRFRTGETIHLTCEASQVVVLPNIESSQTPISEP